jgi:hypothetical protein
MVEITPWTTQQEEMIVRHTQSPDRNGPTLIDKLLAENVRYPAGFVYDKLLVTDQHYLIMKLRSISITCIYTVDHSCSSCGNEHEQQYNIDELPVKVPEEKPEWNEPFRVTLPKCKAVIGLRHLRVSDQKAIRDNAKRKEGIAAIQDDTFIFTMARKVVEIDDNKDLHIKDVMAALRQLIKLDYDVLSNHADRFETGIEENVIAKCPRCRSEDKWALPLQMGFFRPKRADIDAAIAMACESGS